MKKKALFIIGDFWPTKGGGVIRVEKLIKYLPEFNWTGIVLTRKIKPTNAYEQISNVPIYRTKTFNPAELYQKIKRYFKFKTLKNLNKGDLTPAISPTRRANSRLADNFLVPDVDIFWAILSVFRLKKIVKEENIDVIYSSSPSASVHISALIYKKLFNQSIKWIVEFRDPWTFNPFRNKKMIFLEKLDHYLEKKVLNACDEVIVVSKTFVDEFSYKYPNISKNKFSYIPNGYDSEDFKGLAKREPSNTFIEIVHMGNFYGKRSLKPFLMAMKIIADTYPEYQNYLRFTQFGVVDIEGEVYNLNNPNSMITFKGVIPHSESLQEMVNADWLLLIPGPGVGTMTGKLYEYLATGNPIIALADDGAAKDLIKKLNIGYVSNPADVDDIVNVLMEIVGNKGTYKSIDIDNSEIKKFDRRNIAHQVSKVLDSLHFSRE